jgi:putative oxidoreductase
MFSSVIILAHLLLGGAFVVFGLRNIKSIPRLAAVLEGRNIPQPRQVMMLGVGVQIAGGLLTALAPFGPFGVPGGLVMIAFLVVAIVLFHPFWAFSGDERIPHVNAAITNTSLVGAFLMVIGLGLAG